MGKAESKRGINIYFILYLLVWLASDLVANFSKSKGVRFPILHEFLGAKIKKIKKFQLKDHLQKYDHFMRVSMDKMKKMKTSTKGPSTKYDHFMSEEKEKFQLRDHPWNTTTL